MLFIIPGKLTELGSLVDQQAEIQNVQDNGSVLNMILIRRLGFDYVAS